MEDKMELKKPYSKGFYNKYDHKEQWIRLSEGCPNKCPYCAEGIENPDLIVHEIPELIRNKVKLMDMNLLAHPEALDFIKELGRRRVNGKVIYYELICGVDYRFLTQEIAIALRQSRFKNIRFAWDNPFAIQKQIRKATQLLLNAGYKPRNIMVFMICNWKISYEDNMRKMDLCKVWNFQIADCWYDAQLPPNVKPAYWKENEIKDFRKRVRKHNQLIAFRIDPEDK